MRVEAAPVNPSDLGLLLAMADVSQAVAGGSADDPIRDGADRGAGRCAPWRRGSATSMAGRQRGGRRRRSGGDLAEAQALLGRTVGFLGGATYAEYCLASAADVPAAARGRGRG